jgi:tripartite-type tricarboxylate transporter receptor subunit TctC
MIESGFPAFIEAPWFGCVAPAGVPPAILNKLSDAFVALRGDADLAKRVAELGYRLDVLGAQDFAALIAKERKIYGHIAEGGRLDRPN